MRLEPIPRKNLFDKAGFIYHIPLTEWVSNIVPMAKKKGYIRVCIDFQDLNKDYPKDNFPTPHIDINNQ